MNITRAPLDGVLVLEPRVHTDERGYLVEVWSRDRYREAGIPTDFAQDNISRSARGVLRGMHFQRRQPQGKLVTAPVGEVFDVAVDLRRESPTFGAWWGCILSAENHRQLWIPPGCAHGFLVLSDEALLTYKCTTYYDAASDCTLLWSDPDVGIEWPAEPTVISEKDRQGLRLRDLMPDATRPRDALIP